MIVDFYESDWTPDVEGLSPALASIFLWNYVLQKCWMPSRIDWPPPGAAKRVLSNFNLP